MLSFMLINDKTKIQIQTEQLIQQGMSNFKACTKQKIKWY